MAVQSIFDTRRAIFEPRELREMQAAFRAAVALLGPGLMPETERTLGKVIVNLARRQISEKADLDAETITREAANLISTLRTSTWLS